MAYGGEPIARGSAGQGKLTWTWEWKEFHFSLRAEGDCGTLQRQVIG